MTRTRKSSVANAGDRNSGEFRYPKFWAWPCTSAASSLMGSARGARFLAQPVVGRSGRLGAIWRACRPGLQSSGKRQADLRPVPLPSRPRAIRVFLASAISLRSRRRSSKASRVESPCLRAFLLPLGAPDPSAPPCIRHRSLPLTVGARHELPFRVRAPHLGQRCMGNRCRRGAQSCPTCRRSTCFLFVKNRLQVAQVV